jgi:hypothetical protein
MIGPTVLAAVGRLVLIAGSSIDLGLAGGASASCGELITAETKLAEDLTDCRAAGSATTPRSSRVRPTRSPRPIRVL